MCKSCIYTDYSYKERVGEKVKNEKDERKKEGKEKESTVAKVTKKSVGALKGEWTNGRQSEK